MRRESNKEILLKKAIESDTLNIPVNEELSISTEIENDVKIIKKKLIAEFNKNAPQTDEHKTLVYHARINHVFKETNIIVDCTGYFFDDDTEENEKSELYDFSSLSGRTRGGNYVIQIHFPIKRGYVDDMFFGATIAHELTHIDCLIHQYDKSIRFAEIYERCERVMTNRMATKKEFETAESFYCCCRFERAAFAHGLNEILKTQTQIIRPTLENIYNIFTETQEYNYLKKVKTFLDNIDDYNNEIEMIIHMRPNAYKNYLEKTYKEFTRTLHRVLYRITELYRPSYNIQVINNINTKASKIK